MLVGIDVNFPGTLLNGDNATYHNITNVRSVVRTDRANTNHTILNVDNAGNTGEDFLISSLLLRHESAVTSHKSLTNVVARYYDL